MLDKSKLLDESGFPSKYWRNYKYNHPVDEEVVAILGSPGSNQREKINNYLGQHPVTSVDHTKDKTVEVNKQSGTTSSTITTDKALPTDDEGLLRLHGYDPAIWKVLSAKSSQWEAQSELGIKQLTASKITIAKKDFDEAITDYDKLDELFNFKPKLEYCLKSTIDHGKMLLIPIADLHFGMVAYDAYGNETNNMDITEKRLQAFVEDVILKAKSLYSEHINEVHLVLGNDFFNADNMYGTTFKGTQQVQETNYYNIYEKAFKMMVTIIEKIKAAFGKDAVVVITGVKANHDMTASYHFLHALNAYYRDSKNVDIEPGSLRQNTFVLKYGKNMIGFSHDMKPKNCLRELAHKGTVFWSETTHKYFFIAHLHHEETNEDGDVLIRRLPILSGASDWAKSMGYSNAGPRAQAFVFDYDDGEEIIIERTFPYSE